MAFDHPSETLSEPPLKLHISDLGRRNHPKTRNANCHNQFFHLYLYLTMLSKMR